MLHANPRWITTCLAMLVVFSILLATPRLAFAEGEAPEEAPPDALPPAEQPAVTSPVEIAVQELAAADASLVDNSGAAVPMASQSALDILCEPDPWFYGTLCPGGKCLGYGSISDALGDWGIKRGFGMIYLEGSFNGWENVYIDGSSGMHPEYLTLRGIVQDTTTSGTPKLNGSIDVSNLTGGFTIQGIDIDGHLNFYVNRGLININRVNIDQSGEAETNQAYGIIINSHAGPVTLNQVVVENTQNYGVWIDNTFGEIPTGAVTITNLTVLNNYAESDITSRGLYISSMSPININGIYLKDNVGSGALIHNNGAAVTIKNGYIGFSKSNGIANSGNGLTILGIPYKGSITLENMRIYDNEYIGIRINSVGLITLKNVYSNGNDEEGLYIEGNSPTSPGALLGLNISNSQFNWNDSDGILAFLYGPVTITNTSLNYSLYGSGLSLYGFSAGLPIVLTDINANNNTGHGLLIWNKGSVNLNNVNAVENGDLGAEIRQNGGGFTVTINRSNFDRNAMGLWVENKNIILNGVSASWNNLYGANLDSAISFLNTGTISILSTLGRWNYFNNNTADPSTMENYGLRINTFGAVTINNTEVAENSYYGIDLRNDEAGLGAPVTLNSVYITGNGGFGMYVLTSGAFTWNYGSSSGNDQILQDIEIYGGLILENQVSSKPVTIKGVNFDENAQGNGLDVYSLGNITLNQVSASRNYGKGALLRNNDGTGGITLLGAGVSGNEFFYNINNGLDIYTNGATSITNIDAVGNSSYGVYITSGSPLGVSVLSASPNWVNTFHGNLYAGLEIITPGNIKLVNIQASGNGDIGTKLDNCMYEYNGIEDVCFGFGSITLSSLGNNTNIFDENVHGGFFADSWGNITLANISSSGSTYDNGVNLDNQWNNFLGVASMGNITINNLVQMDFSDNITSELDGYGLWAASNGAITVKGVHADGNGKGGVYLNNWNSALPKPVTISNSSFYNTHNGKGLEVYSWGKISLSNVYAYGNDVVTGSIDLGESISEKIHENNAGSPDRWIYNEVIATGIIAGFYYIPDFNGNLSVWDNTVSANIDLNWDGYHFWFESILGHEYIFEVYSLDPDYMGDYTLELYEFVDDNFDGLPDYMGKTYIDDGLGGTGIFLDNSDGLAGITITGTSVNHNRLENNGGDGLFLLSNGAVIVNYTDSLENGGMGLNLNTNIYDDWAPPAAVTLTGLNLENNGYHGLGVRTLGSIAWSNSRSTGNLGYASDLDNCQYDDFSYGGCRAVIAKPITLTSLVSDGNRSSGFVANSFGSITASGIVSRNSGGSGMVLNNAYTGSTGSITLLGTLGENQFMNNWFTGLRAFSNGNVTLNNIRAEWNGEGNSEAGIRVYSHGTVLISNGVIENNYNNGIYAITYDHLITLSNLAVMMNGGLWWDNRSANGIEIIAYGTSPVIISNSVIFGSGGHGYAIFDYDSVSLPGTLMFGNNQIGGAVFY